MYPDQIATVGDLIAALTTHDPTTPVRSATEGVEFMDHTIGRAVYPCAAPLPRTRRVATRDLRPGMRLLLPHVMDLGRPVRTVARVAENGMVNQHDEPPLVNVYYAEPADENWGAANSGCWESEWNVIETRYASSPSAGPHWSTVDCEP